MWGGGGLGYQAFLPSVVPSGGTTCFVVPTSVLGSASSRFSSGFVFLVGLGLIGHLGGVLGVGKIRYFCSLHREPQQPVRRVVRRLLHVNTYIAEGWRKPYRGAINAIQASLEVEHKVDRQMGDNAGPIIMVFPVVLVTRSCCGRHLVLPRGVLGCHVPPWVHV